jgi:hypothetical protein
VTTTETRGHQQLFKTRGMVNDGEYSGPKAFLITIKIITLPVVWFLMGVEFISRAWKKTKTNTVKEINKSGGMAKRISEKLAENKRRMARVIPMLNSVMYGEMARLQILEARKEFKALDKKIKQIEREGKTHKIEKMDRAKKIGPQKIRAKTEQILRTVYQCDGTRNQH